MKPEIIVIAHDMRSTFNVGSLFRTAEGLGVNKLYLTGYTPYPAMVNDPRLPHVSSKLDTQIEKTALGASKTLAWEYAEDITELLKQLKHDGCKVAALEQTAEAEEVHTYKAPDKIALLLGTEVSGLPAELLKQTDVHLIIPMYGQKESFNVVQAAAMAMFQLRFHT